MDDLGITKVRFTGGEPLLRRDLAEIIAAAASLRTAAGAPPDIALTKNGLGLDRRLPELIEAGLQRVNISLDTMDSDHYARLTRRDRYEDVRRSIDAVDKAGLPRPSVCTRAPASKPLASTWVEWTPAASAAPAK